MEKQEKIREYCIDVALQIHRPYADLPRPSAEDVIKTAKKLEEYITDVQYPKGGFPETGTGTYAPDNYTYTAKG